MTFTPLLGAHQCAFCQLPVARYVLTDTTTKAECRATCTDLRDIETQINAHRLLLSNPSGRSANSRAQLRRSLAAAESAANLHRRRIRVALGLENPMPDGPDLWAD